MDLISDKVWSKTPVSQIAEIILGGTPKTRVEEYWGGTISWASAKDISNNIGRYIYKTEKSITKKGLDNSNARLLPKGTIVITARGTVGKLAILPQELCFNQSCYGIINKKEINSLFLYYAIKESLTRIQTLTYGTIFDTITIKTFDELEVFLPDKLNQDVISSILNFIDSLIELNYNINTTLEKIAKAIFKSWFVDFEPFQDLEFIDSNLGMIPTGWKVGVLKDILSSLESGKRPKGGVGELSKGIPSIGAENIIGLGKYDYSKDKYVLIDFYNKMKKGHVMSGDVLLYKDGAQIGRKSLFMDGFPHQTCCINEHVFILRVNNSLPSSIFLYLWLDQEIVTEKIKNLNSGAVQPGINMKSVFGLKILIPEIKIVNKFNDIVQPIIKKIMLNGINCKKLIELRDLLLPQLVSGRIRIKNPKKLLEEISY